MIPKGLFTQIGMVIVAIAIIITYVKPEFGKIAEVQDEIGEYQNQRSEVAEVNATLDDLIVRLNGVSRTDQAKLNTYLPEILDEIAVQRDLLLISQEAGTFYNISAVVDEASQNTRQSVTPSESLSTPHKFDLSVEGTYSQVKEMFRLLEQNDYPLEVTTLTVDSREGDFLSVEAVLTTYRYKPLVIN